jgi:hypothetical protein
MSKTLAKFYYVTNCKVSKTEVWSGYVMNINDEPIIDSIKRKLGRDSLLCELTNEGFDYNQIKSIYSIPLKELCLGDMMVLSGKFSIYDF